MGSPVAAAQRYLAILGYLDGTVDGIVGPATSNAASRFQRAHGLAADGRVTGDLVDALAAATAAQRAAESGGG